MKGFFRLNFKITFLLIIFISSANAEHDIYRAINPDEYEKYNGLLLGGDGQVHTIPLQEHLLLPLLISVFLEILIFQ